jgi:prepilin-type processing-associated H-X9-DG protein
MIRRYWWIALLALAVILIILMVFPVFVRHRGSRIDQCVSNVKNIALAFQMYLADNGDRFPSAVGWCDRLDEYVMNRDVFRCPQGEGLVGEYAYNAALDGASVADLADREHTIVVFESDWGWNAGGGLELVADQPRHRGSDNYGFADGHAQQIRRKQNPDGTWAKEPEADWVIWEVAAREPEG